MEKVKVSDSKTTTAVKSLHSEIHSIEDDIKKEIKDLADLHQADINELTNKMTSLMTEFNESTKDEFGTVYKLLVVIFILICALFALILV